MSPRIAAVKNTDVGWARACGHAVTRLVEPARLRSAWRDALYLVQPDTLLRLCF